MIFSLALLAISLNIKFNFSNENKINNWIDYDSSYSILINKITDESVNLIGDQYQVSGINKVIKNAAEKAYPEQTFRQNIKLLLNSNLNWIKGNTTIPEFNINLINIKNNFADQIGNYYKNQIEQLPLCSQIQLVEVNSALAVNCWPPNVSPSVGSNKIKNQILKSNIFLNTNNFSSVNAILNKGSNNAPYYHQYSKVAKDYQLSQKLIPYLSIIIIVSILFIYFVHPRRQKGVRSIGWGFIFGGVITYIYKLIIDPYGSKISTNVSNTSSIQAFQKPIDHFTSSAIQSLNKTIIINSIVYIIIGFIILITSIFYILKNRRKDS